MKSWRVRVRGLVSWSFLVFGVIAAGYFLLFKPVEVRAHRVSRGEVLVEALGTGSVESRRTVDVSFEVTARLVQIHVDQGDRVEVGQKLASIDNATFTADVALAEQEVALARATLRRLDADIERSRAVLKGANDGLERVRPLVGSGAASEEALDVAEERQKVAMAELARSQAAQLEGQEAVSTARRRLDRAKASLDRTMVESPFDGVVLSRRLEVGDVAVPGASVLELAATDTVWASVWVDETYLDSLKVGLPARIALRSDVKQTLLGEVARIGHEVDRETRELLVDVAFDKLPERLAFGQRVDLWIELARRHDVLCVPAHVVIQQDGQTGVFIADGSYARFQAVEFGLRGRDRVEVINGLSGDDVVLDPFAAKHERLRDGQRIRLADLDGGADQ
ncbi:MAG: efflux RND transporter periplasmic adaptor subunit [Planctomycetota bacterium]